MALEVEIKALLTKEKYEELRYLLPTQFKKINEDSVTTFRFRPKDVRVRWSNKMHELVYKDGDPTSLSRKEITVNLAGEEECRKMLDLLRELGFANDPSWLKQKAEFIVNFRGHEYTLSLQFIQNFAYLIEAEIITDENIDQHASNLKDLLASLGCTPLDAEEFKARIQDYIRQNKTL